MQLLLLGAAAVALRRSTPIAAPEPAFASSVTAANAAEAAESVADQEAAADSGAAVADLVGSEAAADLGAEQPAEEAGPEAYGEEDLTGVEGAPTHPPLETFPDESPDVAAAAAALVPEAPPANVSERDDLPACHCDCCVAVERDTPTHATNWTCAPGIFMKEENLACDLTGVITCNAEEPLDYTLYCKTHCRAVATEVQTQCMALTADQLTGAKKDGVWTDPLVPAIEELPPGARPDGMGGEEEPPPPTSSPQEREDVATQKAIVDALYAPGGPVHAAQTSLRNAQRVAF